jgi:hypothetical protein
MSAAVPQQHHLCKVLCEPLLNYREPAFARAFVETCKHTAPDGNAVGSWPAICDDEGHRASIHFQDTMLTSTHPNSREVLACG